MSWPVNIAEARKIQDDYRNKVKIAPLGKSPDYIAGVDAAFSDDRVIGVACLYKYP
ncbi:MAG TPA: hypothetical protein VJL62_00675 [Thermodesulfobacteriota bacterium]|nr:hypothetical protein [Thermodesulfobacteriota bacterium]